MSRLEDAVAAGRFLVTAELLTVNAGGLDADDVTAGDEPEARRVFDLDSIQLLVTASAMRNGRYLSGRKIQPAPRLYLGAVENPSAPPVDHRVERALKKVRAGARFLQLQVGFERAPLERFMAEAVST